MRGGRAASSQQLQPLRGSLRLQHPRLVDEAHAHPLGDERAQSQEGSRGAGGHGAMVAAAGRPGQVWFWAARRAIAPAGIPSGMGVMRLQPPGSGSWCVAPVSLALRWRCGNQIHGYQRRGPRKLQQVGEGCRAHRTRRDACAALARSPPTRPT